MRAYDRVELCTMKWRISRNGSQGGRFQVKVCIKHGVGFSVVGT